MKSLASFIHQGTCDFSSACYTLLSFITIDSLTAAIGL